MPAARATLLVVVSAASEISPATAHPGDSPECRWCTLQTALTAAILLESDNLTVVGHNTRRSFVHAAPEASLPPKVAVRTYDPAVTSVAVWRP